jgi:D-sedoheptulose 7-phosphate isomerase
VLAGLETARRLGLSTIALTGRATGVAVPADVHVAVPADRTPRVQEVHGTLLHILCEVIEAEMERDHEDTK